VKKYAVFTLLLCLPPQMVLAEPSVLPLSMRHKSNIEASTGIGTGNADYQNYRVAGKYVYTKGKFVNELSGDFSESEKKNNAPRYSYKVGNKAKYAIGEKTYVLGEIDRSSKKIAGVKSRTSETIGFGRDLIAKDDFTLAGEVAGGLRQSDYGESAADENSVLGKIGADMNWKVHRNINLNNYTSMGFTENNTQTISDTNLKAFIYDNLYAKGGIEVENNTMTPAGFKKTDTITSVALGYEF
jgi:putative salt-induced outer membrane protein